MKWLKNSALAALFWAVSFSAPYSWAESSLTAEGLKSSLAMNESLLTSSSLVQNVKEVDLPQVSEALDSALSFHQTALKKLSNGDLTGAAKARDESLNRLMLASRLASKANGFVEAKAKADYEKRVTSVGALITAHQRITDSDGSEKNASILQETILPLIKRSEDSAKKQDFKSALTSLDKAYFLLVTSIKSQRTGQTLVRSLDFATEKEAYEYELGRYENYQMLVNMMIDERKAFKRDARTKPFFDEADNYQRQADDLAKRGEYTKAAELIEKGSKSLVNLLRDSGVHIPGV